MRKNEAKSFQEIDININQIKSINQSIIYLFSKKNNDTCNEI